MSCPSSFAASPSLLGLSLRTPQHSAPVPPPMTLAASPSEPGPGPPTSLSSADFDRIDPASSAADAIQSRGAEAADGARRHHVGWLQQVGNGFKTCLMGLECGSILEDIING